MEKQPFKLSLIVAAAANDTIGADNKLLWRIPQDLRRFKAKTWGHPLIMGRRTFESIGRPLPGRTTIVLTHCRAYAAPDCLTSSSLPAALKLAAGLEPTEVFIAGGGKVYAQAIDLADTIYLTRIHRSFVGDTVFPSITADWIETVREDFLNAPLPYSFLTYTRRQYS